MVLKSRDFVFRMSIFKKMSMYCTVYTGTCICSSLKKLSLHAAVVVDWSITASGRQIARFVAS